MRARGTAGPPRGGALGFFLVPALLVASCGNFYVVPEGAAASDTGSPRDAAPTSPCVPGLAFCDDFEGQYGVLWDDASAASCSPDSTFAFSGRTSMRVSFANSPANYASHLTAAISIPLNKDLRLAFELHVERAADVYAFGIWFHDYYVTWNAGTGEIGEQVPLEGGSYDHPSHVGIAAPTSTWVHIELDVSRSKGTAVLRVGGASKTVTLDGAAFLTQDDKPGLFMGVFDAGPGLSWDVHIDDVVVSLL